MKTYKYLGNILVGYTLGRLVSRRLATYRLCIAYSLAEITTSFMITRGLHEAIRKAYLPEDSPVTPRCKFDVL